MNPSFDQIIKLIRKTASVRAGKDSSMAGRKGTVQRGRRSLTSTREPLRKVDQMVAQKPRKYSGQWVALDGDRLIANGPTAKEVYSKAKAEGFEIPFVELVTDHEPVPSTGGWLS
jgi:hypothetical protein